ARGRGRQQDPRRTAPRARSQDAVSQARRVREGRRQDAPVQSRRARARRMIRALALLVLCSCDRVFALHAFQPLPPDAPPPDAPPDAPPAPGGLVAWYPMEAVGPPIDCMADATARGHDGQCLINVPTSILGMHGNAYH